MPGTIFLLQTLVFLIWASQVASSPVCLLPLKTTHGAPPSVPCALPGMDICWKGSVVFPLPRAGAGSLRLANAFHDLSLSYCAVSCHFEWHPPPHALWWLLGFLHAPLIYLHSPGRINWCSQSWTWLFQKASSDTTDSYRCLSKTQRIVLSFQIQMNQRSYPSTSLSNDCKEIGNQVAQIKSGDVWDCEGGPQQFLPDADKLGARGEQRIWKLCPSGGHVSFMKRIHFMSPSLHDIISGNLLTTGGNLNRAILLKTFHR